MRVGSGRAALKCLAWDSGRLGEDRSSWLFRDALDAEIDLYPRILSWRVIS